uniref:Uncharacterized protein n=1 Tax=Lepeophtheirus salmonis TaxID=72036 RepID=A0A0K2UGD4_LEPSM
MGQSLSAKLNDDIRFLTKFKC